MAGQKIVYLSTEYGLSDLRLPLYAGGLGVLSGDTLYEASDMGLPLVAVGFAYRKGIFKQIFDENGRQGEEYQDWDPAESGLELVKDLKGKDLLLEVALPGHRLYLKVWRANVGLIPLYLLDANLEQNSLEDRKITEYLYPGDWGVHLFQDIAFGIGSVKLIRALGIESQVWHLNDDHTAFSALYRLYENLFAGKSWEEAVEKVRAKTVYTTHTTSRAAESGFYTQDLEPFLEAGFDHRVSDYQKIYRLGGLGEDGRDNVSLSVAAFRLSRKINAVSLEHKAISKSLWSFVWPASPWDNGPIGYVTNGVYVPGWVEEGMGALYEQYLVERGGDPEVGRGSQAPKPDGLGALNPSGLKGSGSGRWDFTRASEIPSQEFWEARLSAKEKLLKKIEERVKVRIGPEAFVIGFARRFVDYKRPQLVLEDRGRLARILKNPQLPAHLIFSGKVHPSDEMGKGILRDIISAVKDPVLSPHIIYLPDHDLELAKLLTAGSDLWLNNPRSRFEGCGTSGMKALYNGVLNASTLTGWWKEAYKEGLGWAISEGRTDAETSQNLYDLLEGEIVPLYFQDRPKWAGMVKAALAQLGPRFSMERMLGEYRDKLYRV